MTEKKTGKPWHFARIPFITIGLGGVGMVSLSIMVVMSPRFEFGFIDVMGILIKQLSLYYLDIFGQFYLWNIEPLIPALLIITVPMIGVISIFTRRYLYIPISVFLALFLFFPVWWDILLHMKGSNFNWP